MSGSPARVKGSLLDRLTNPRASENGLSLREYHASVRRDLEALLNARRPRAPVPPGLPAVRDSMFAYGLPDYASGAFNAAEQREALCREIAATIKRFEPRLSPPITVTPLDRPDSMEPVLRIRIQAMLVAEDADEPVSFETVLDTTTADIAVRADTNG
jgi:type VI secretion system protein ImpF